MDGQHHVLAALPWGKTRYPLYKRVDGPQGRSGRVRKISSPPGLDPRNVQLVASLYTDWAITVHTFVMIRKPNVTQLLLLYTVEQMSIEELRRGSSDYLPASHCGGLG
jgi:hypothetical protein